MIARWRLEQDLERLRSMRAEAERYRQDAARCILYTIALVQASHRQAVESWSLLGEGRLDMARRHVRQAQMDVAGQYLLIERLKLLGLPTGSAENLLHELNAALRNHQRDLDDLLEQHDGG